MINEVEIGDLINALFDEPLLFLLGTAGLFLLMQASYLLAALLTTCLGGGCESWGAGYARTLSRWYQLTPWHAMLMLMLIGAMLLINDLESDYYSTYYYYDGSISTQALEQERARFLLDAGRVGTVTLYLALNLWLTLATLAAHRDRPTWHASCRWPAVCEGCGYALLGLDEDADCPECGKPVHDSKHSGRGPIRDGYWALTLRALTQPSRLGAQMTARRPMQKHYRVLLFALLWLVVFGPVAVGMAELSEALTGYYYGGSALDYIGRYVFGGLLAGVSMAAFGAFVCLAAGSLHALFAKMFSKRDALPAAAQACCLTAGLLPFWAFAGMLSLIVVRFAGEWIYDRGLYGYEMLLPIGWLLFHAFLFVLYFSIVGRVCRAARHANV